ncbi:DUF1830 domain-containing protein [Phormidesmis sp. 146-12]
MVLTSASLPDGLTERILCYYVNVTNRLQIAQIKNIPGFRFERLIFPRQRLLFEAIPEAMLEIYTQTTTQTTTNSTPTERISCFRLQVNRNAAENGQQNMTYRAEETSLTEE